MKIRLIITADKTEHSKSYSFDTARVAAIPASVSKLSDAELDTAMREAIQRLYPIPYHSSSRPHANVLLAEKVRRGKGQAVENWRIGEKA